MRHRSDITRLAIALTDRITMSRSCNALRSPLESAPSPIGWAFSPDMSRTQAKRGTCWNDFLTVLSEERARD